MSANPPYEDLEAGTTTKPKIGPDLPPLTFLETKSLRNATTHFLNKEYAEASAIFADILSNRLLDSRISHNLVISGFYQNQLRDVDCFLQQFLPILSEVDIYQAKSLHPDQLTHPVFLYNLALIYFQDRQPWKSLEIAIGLSKSFQRSLESLSPASALENRTHLLLIEIYITLQQFELALDMIVRGRSPRASPVTQPSTGGYKSQGNIPGSPQPQLNSTDFVDEESQIPRDCFKAKMSEYKILSLFSLHSVTSGRKEYKNLRTLMSSLSLHDPGLRALDFLKAHQNYLRGNLQKALRLTTAIPNRNNHEIFMETGDNLCMMLNNNIGCCHYSSGKPTVAAWFFQKASQESNKQEYKERPTLPLHCLSFNKKYEIMYNFGVSLLHAKKSLEAFNILSLCQTAFPSNPRLWLRIAECCIQLHKSTNDEDFRWTEEKRNLLLGIPVESREREPIPTEVVDPERPTPSLTFALHCIRMALTLLNSDPGFKVKRIEVRPSNPITSPAEIALLHANVVCTGAYLNLQLGFYAEAIEMSNHLLTLPLVPNAFQYLGRMYLSEATLKAGRVGNGVELFSEHSVPYYQLNLRLSPQEESHWVDPGGSTPTHGDDSSLGFKAPAEWSPRDELTARATMVYNRAVALSALHQFEAAAHLLHDWEGRFTSRTSQPLPPDFILLQIHVHLKLGNHGKAAQIYRTHCPSHKSPSRVTSAANP